MKQHLRRLRYRNRPESAPGLSAEQMALALVLAARAAGELPILSARLEGVLSGAVALRSRWVALAALLALHQQAEVQLIAEPLGCGFNPLRELAGHRGSSRWDEDLVGQLFVALASPEDANPLGEAEARLAAAAAAVIRARMSRWAARAGVR